MIYVATAELSIAAKALKQYQKSNKHSLLEDADRELKRAIELIENHYRVKYSIVWIESKASTKKRIKEDIDRIAFDAYAAILNTGEILNNYVDFTNNNPPDLKVWFKVIEYLTEASRSMQKENYPEIYYKQLILFES
jgi:hypothetical protein